MSLSAADWKTIPSGIESDLLGLHFINDDSGFVISTNGLISFFENDGSQWKASRKKFHYKFKGICFSEGGRGFFYGSFGTIVYTDDLGESWDRLMFDKDIVFYDMAFFDSLNGVVVGTNSKSRQGYNGVVFHTSDGGHSWDSLSIGANRIRAVHTSEDGVGTITGLHYLFISDDNGKQWDRVRLPDRHTVNAAFLGKQNGLMVGMNGFVSITSDSGSNWQEQKNLPGDISLFDLANAGKNKFFAIGSQCNIFYSNDGGRNWVPELTDCYFDLRDIKKAENRIFVCGRKGTLLYADIK
jgi:photosystem II stability/assembly factor-like uncharacterized protein